jgi:Ubiquitin-2 like Rad60 SUMO-like
MGSCIKKSEIAGNTDLLRETSKKNKTQAFKPESTQESFVNIKKKDGELEMFIHRPPQPPQVSSNETLALTLETIDLKKHQISIQASEKISTLKQKACELVSIPDLYLIFNGTVLDSTSLVGSILFQNCTVDIIPI